MLRLGAEQDEVSVVDDQRGSPTYVGHLAEAVRELVDGDRDRGIWHLTAHGDCTWADFAEAVFEEAGLDCRVRRIASDELDRPATRPAYSVLRSERPGAPQRRTGAKVCAPASSASDPNGWSFAGAGTIRSMPRKVLVVSTVENAVDAIRDELGADVEAVEVVVPVVRQGVLDWLANDERAFRAAQEAAERQAEQLPAEVVAARAGEADVELAIRDALATFPADEVVVAVRPEDQAGGDRALGAGRGSPRPSTVSLSA